MSAVYDAAGNFQGHDPRPCGEHRTVGEHRAWCFQCREWCYLDEGCLGCRTVILLRAVQAGELSIDQAVDKVLGI
jgi:hypothetical protein